jgi:NADH-quinone oxidoreductase subunit E
MRVQRINNKKKLISEEGLDLRAMDPLIEQWKDKKGNMIPLLQRTQEIYGYLPRIALCKIAEETGLQLNEIYGVATFYAQFRLNPVGKHIIKVCHGTACHVQDAETITASIRDALKIEDGETTEDGLFTLESVACLGCCSLAPVMMIDDTTYGKLTGKQAVKIIKDIKISERN